MSKFCISNVKPIALHNYSMVLFSQCCFDVFLGSIVFTDKTTQAVIKARLGKARCAFTKLQITWKSKQYTMKTKLSLYNSNGKSIFLYGSECWRVATVDMAKIHGFHDGCLRRICGIFWPNKISNVQLYNKSGCNSVVLKIKCRRLRWLEHFLRMPKESIPKVALRWTPPGTNTTWRKTVMTELQDMGRGSGPIKGQDEDDK